MVVVGRERGFDRGCLAFRVCVIGHSRGRSSRFGAIVFQHELCSILSIDTRDRDAEHTFGIAPTGSAESNACCPVCCVKLDSCRVDAVQSNELARTRTRIKVARLFWVGRGGARDPLHPYCLLSLEMSPRQRCCSRWRCRILVFCWRGLR